MNDRQDYREQRREERKQRWEERRQRWEERREYSMMHRSGHNNIWTGLFLVIIGAAAFIRISVPDLPHWVFGWQTFLIALGLFVGVRHGFRGGSWFILMLIGGIFLVSEINPELTLRRYLWPVILMAVGLMFIFRPKRRWQQNQSGDGEKKNSACEDPFLNPAPTYTKEDFVDSTSIFGGAKKIIISKNFRGGDLVNIFGGTELDLTQADFTGTAVIELTTIFGGTKLVIPSNWSVKSEAVTIFGGMEDKRNIQTITDQPEKILILKGTVIFGGIDIKSY